MASAWEKPSFPQPVLWRVWRKNVEKSSYKQFPQSFPQGKEGITHTALGAAIFGKGVRIFVIFAQKFGFLKKI